MNSTLSFACETNGKQRKARNPKDLWNEDLNMNVKLGYDHEKGKDSFFIELLYQVGQALSAKTAGITPFLLHQSSQCIWDSQLCAPAAFNFRGF